MAQTGYTPIQLYYSSTTTNVPLAADLANGELAINITDGKLFYKDNASAVQVIAWKVTPTTAGGTGLTSYTAGDLTYYASGTTFSKLAIGASGRYLSSTGSAPQWSAPAALTKTDDTNVTLTLGGSASTALLNAASLTLGWTGTLAATRGGTGLGSYAVGDILYADTTTSLAKLADVATGNALISGGVGVAPSWGKIGLTTHVSGTLGTGNGGTGTATAFTAGSVVFAGASGVYSQNNSNFFWDNTNNRLGLGTASPATWLHILAGNSSASDFEVARFVNNGENGTYLNFNNAFGALGRFTVTKYGGGSSADDGKMIFSLATNSVLATCATLDYVGNFSIVGALSKGSGSFKIDHPIPSMTDTHHLVHSFVEAPQADLYYRGKVALVNGQASVNIDQASGMTEGTFVLLCRDVQCFTSNETDWDAVRGSVSGNILTIECQNQTSTAMVSWLVIGERQDKHMMDTDWTDKNGKVIVEPLKVNDDTNVKENV
jgi:hypothetical protein